MKRVQNRKRHKQQAPHNNKKSVGAINILASISSQVRGERGPGRGAGCWLELWPPDQILAGLGPLGLGHALTPTPVLCTLGPRLGCSRLDEVFDYKVSDLETNFIKKDYTIQLCSKTDSTYILILRSRTIYECLCKYQTGCFVSQHQTLTHVIIWFQ